MNKTQYLSVLHDALTGDCPPWQYRDGLLLLELQGFSIEVSHSPNATTWRMTAPGVSSLMAGQSQTRMEAVREAVMWGEHYVKTVLFNHTVPTC